jgi:hypothetical protein
LDAVDLPEDAHAFFEKEPWPKRVSHLAVPLRIDEDIPGFPWGVPAAALNNALRGTPAYTEDTMYHDDAATILRDLEEWYIGQADRTNLTWKTLHNWPISAELKKQLRTLMLKLGATSDSHPDYIPTKKSRAYSSVSSTTAVLARNTGSSNNMV